jgi:hypothetical protein
LQAVLVAVVVIIFFVLVILDDLRALSKDLLELLFWELELIGILLVLLLKVGHQHLLLLVVQLIDIQEKVFVIVFAFNHLFTFIIFLFFKLLHLLLVSLVLLLLLVGSVLRVLIWLLLAALRGGLMVADMLRLNLFFLFLVFLSFLVLVLELLALVVFLHHLLNLLDLLWVEFEAHLLRDVYQVRRDLVHLVVAHLVVFLDVDLFLILVLCHDVRDFAVNFIVQVLVRILFISIDVVLRALFPL